MSVLEKIWSRVPNFLKTAYENSAFDRAATLSFYTIFAVAPLLWISSALLATIYKTEEARERTIQQVSAYFSPEMVEFLKDLLRAVDGMEFGGVSGALSFVFLFIGASRGFAYLRESIAVIFHQAIDDPKTGFVATLVSYAVSFAVTAAIGGFIFALNVANFILSFVLSFVQGYLVPLPAWVLSATQTSLFILFLCFALMLLIQSLSRFRHHLRDLFLGSFIVSFLFFFGRYIFELYFQSSILKEAYGPIEGVFMLILWIYYSSIIFMLGLEWMAARRLQRKN